MLPIVPPSYVPDDYKLRRTIQTGIVDGFRGAAVQHAFFYTQGWGVDEWNRPLVVYYASPGTGPLFGTGGHPGQDVDLQLGGLMGTYHDGLWSGSGGPNEFLTDSVRFHWDRSVAHSLVVHFVSGRCGVRAPRTISLNDLIKVAANSALNN